MAKDSAVSSTVASRLGLWLLCLLWALSQGGCSSVAVVVATPIAVSLVTAAATAGVKVATEANPTDLSVAGMDGAPVPYPITDVYAGLLWSTEAEGLTILSADASDYVLHVSYPFSLLHNNWGGEITITCAVDGYGTRVLFADNGRDAAGRVQKLESKLLDHTLKRLRQSGLGH
jgi:hypothetical protein